MAMMSNKMVELASDLSYVLGDIHTFSKLYDLKLTEKQGVISITFGGFNPKFVALLEKRISKGVEFLKKTKGPQWWKEINIKTLKLNDPTMCVLGQTFKKDCQDSLECDGFSHVVDKFDMDADAHGFNLDDEFDDIYHNILPSVFRKNTLNPWTLLGELWIQRIRAAKKAR